MATRKQDYEHAYSAGEAAALEWYSTPDTVSGGPKELDAREAEWQRFRAHNGLKPDNVRMRIAFKDGWGDFSDRYDVEAGYAEAGHRTAD